MPGPLTLARSARAWSIAFWPALTELIACLRRVAPEHVDREPEPAHHDDQRQQRQGGPSLRLSPRGQRRDPTIGRSPTRHDALDPRDGPLQCVAGRRPGVTRRRAHRDPGRLHVVGQRDRRSVGRPGEGFVRPDRDEGPAAVRGRHLGRLEGDRAVAARSVGGHEPVMEVLHGRLRVEGQHRILELVHPELGDDVRRHQDERVAHRDLTTPHVGFQRARRQAALPVGVGQGRQPRLADQVGLGRADGRDVHLAAPDDRHADADRAVPVGRLEPQPIGLVGKPLVGGPDRLLETDPDAGRFVVVVLVADRLGRQPSGLERVARRDARGHQQIQVALGARDGTNARFDDDERVGRVGESVMLGDDAKLHL